MQRWTVNRGNSDSAVLKMWFREIVTKVPINPVIRTRTRYFRCAYHPTRDTMKVTKKSSQWWHKNLLLILLEFYPSNRETPALETTDIFPCTLQESKVMVNKTSDGKIGCKWNIEETCNPRSVKSQQAHNALLRMQPYCLTRSHCHPATIFLMTLLLLASAYEILLIDTLIIFIYIL
jgi:hypothetical protein